MAKWTSVVVALLLATSVSGGIHTERGATMAATSEFAFQDSMSEATLHRYLGRAVTFQGLCGEGAVQNFLLDEDIRFLKRTGTKFVSRAALFAWTSTQASQVEAHFAYAKEAAAKVHAADPEVILQAFVAEIVRKAYVNATPVPSWVFAAFDLPAETRSFRFADIIDPKRGPNFWGTDAGYPDYSRLEAQMWYYYCIRRYIDAGFESIHIQEGEDTTEYAAVDRLLTMSRAYAREHARRGVVLFHNFFSMLTGGNKIGDRLLFDIQGNGIVPIETVYENGAMKCKIGDWREPGCDLQWLGRSAGGIHPLGFTVDACPSLLEFDNYGQDPKGTPGVSNGLAFYTWGYDDITWFSVQPAWYRAEFLRYVTDYLKTHSLDRSGDQVYYCMYPVRRVITASPDWPQTRYVPGDSYSTDFLFDYCGASVENIRVDFHEDRSFTLTSKSFYRANRQSDGCPNGFGEEDLIRTFFLGASAPEDPALLRTVLPQGYAPDEKVSSGGSGPSSTQGSSSSSGSRSSGIDGSAASSDGEGSSTPVTGGSVEGSSSGRSDGNGSAASSGDSFGSDTPDGSSDGGDPGSGSGNGDSNDNSTGGILGSLILGGVLLLLTLGGGAVWYVIRKKHA
jgi:hypothetical protein